MILGAVLVTVLAIAAGAWYLRLRGLASAARVYEQVRMLGTLLGVPHPAHQTPGEYGDSVAERLPQGETEVRQVASLYVRQRFSRSGLSEEDGHELKRLWPRLRLLMLRQALTRRKRKPRTPAWVSPSTLRPGNVLE